MTEEEFLEQEVAYWSAMSQHNRATLMSYATVAANYQDRLDELRGDSDDADRP
jgi:hypothetical protein